MAEIITCSECQRKLQVPESFLGQTVQCPECGHQFAAQANPHAVQQEAPAAHVPMSAPLPVDAADEARARRRRQSQDDDWDDDVDDFRPLRRTGIPHRGGAILAIGILAWVLFPYTTWICGPIAWMMGNSDLARIHEGEMDPTGEGMVQAGRVLGMIATIVSMIAIAAFCLIFGLILVSEH